MSTMHSRVAIRSKLTAVSSRPVDQNTVYSFTALDRAMSLHSVHMVFYYKEKLFADFDLDPFRVCLSECLTMYPPVTGRIVRREDGELEVKCTDAGVRVVRATVGVTLDEWLGSADGLEERLLVAWDDMPRDDPSSWSPYRIQINEFEGGGVAIGLSCTHIQADLTCATLLVNSWAESYRREAVAHPPKFNNSMNSSPDAPPLTCGLNIHNTKSSTHAYYEAKSKASKTPLAMKKMSTATFKISNAVMKERLMKIHGSCPHATPFDFLAALFWSRIARLKSPKSDSKHSISICVDMRKKMKLPYGHYGNALHFSLLSLPDVGDNGDLGDVAGAVHHHVSDQGEEEFWSGMEWFESRKGKGDEFRAPFRMYGPELTCVSMEDMVGFPGSTRNATNESLMYAAVFEKDNRAAHVSYHVGNVQGEGLIMVVPSPEGGVARMVMVTLPGEELEQLCEDEAILSLNPTMVLSGKCGTRLT